MSKHLEQVRANVDADEKANSYARDGWAVRLVGITGGINKYALTEAQDEHRVYVRTEMLLDA